MQSGEFHKSKYINGYGNLSFQSVKTALSAVARDHCLVEIIIVIHDLYSAISVSSVALYKNRNSKKLKNKYLSY